LEREQRTYESIGRCYLQRIAPKNAGDLYGRRILYMGQFGDLGRLRLHYLYLSKLSPVHDIPSSGAKAEAKGRAENRGEKRKDESLVPWPILPDFPVGIVLPGSTAGLVSTSPGA
jgi:hypothetical protein